MHVTSNPSILMVANYKPNRGGISAVVENLTDGLRGEGYVVTIFSVSGFVLKRVLLYCALVVKVFNYDVIHCHGSSFWGFLPVFMTAIICKLVRKPLVVTYHGSVINAKVFCRNSFMVRYVQKNSAVITTPIEINAECMRGLQPKSIGIPNIFDAPNWQFVQRERIAPKLVWTRNTYKPELAIEAFKLIKKKYPDSTLVMCGRAATAENLSQYKDLPGLELKGFVSREQLPRVLRHSDIYLNTLGEDSFGYCMFEAMAMGLAVVSVESTSMRYYAERVVMFSAEETPVSFAMSIEAVLEDQEKALERIGYGRDLLTDFTWERLFPVWQDVYKTALIKKRV